MNWERYIRDMEDTQEAEALYEAMTPEDKAEQDARIAEEMDAYYEALWQEEH